jgi:hypothetical protein
MGVVYFVYNGIFAAVILLYVLITSLMAVFSKNPDVRYQPMRDDRGSFIKSQTNLTTELDALGATARGDMRMKTRDLDDDNDSFSSDSLARVKVDGGAGVAPTSLAPSSTTSNRNMNGYEPPHSPIDPSTPFLPSEGAPRHGPPGGFADRNMYSGQGYSDRPSNAPAYGRAGSVASNTSYRPQQSSTPAWQRGAGYEH